jgi:protein-S-isoprenylcysteine O-methyltransferase Ste14
MRTALFHDIPSALEASSITLVNDGCWQVGVPLTPQSARWWGRQTNWCTAWDEPAFYLYARSGHLIVFRNLDRYVSGNRAWQLHAASGEFRDACNRRASWRGFLSRHPELAGALLAAIAIRLERRVCRAVDGFPG